MFTYSQSQPCDPETAAALPSARFRQNNVQGRSLDFPSLLGSKNFLRRPLADLFLAAIGQDRFTYSCLIYYL